MKTLYDRLLPEIKASLEANEGEYAASVNDIKVCLESNQFWMNLTVLEVQRTIMFTDIPYAKISKGTFQFGVNLIDQKS